VEQNVHNILVRLLFLDQTTAISMLYAIVQNCRVKVLMVMKNPSEGSSGVKLA